MTPSLTMPSFFLLVPFAFLLHAIYGANPLFHICSSSQNFETGDPYESNLNALSGYLHNKVPKRGFGFGSPGRYPYRVYGLGLCRGDVSSSNCKTCITEANSEIRQRCLTNKTAIIWYDYCLYKYSENSFFSQIDRTRFYMWNLGVVNNNSTLELNQITKTSLLHLTNEAYASPKLYKTGESEVQETNVKVYGLVQCTKDLNSSVCKNVLDDIIGEFGSCCAGQEGGRVVGGSCNFRYEIYPFVNA